MQTQGNVLAHALRYAERIRIGPSDRVPLLARYTFDAAVMDLFGALLVGATLHLLDPYGPDAADLASALAEIGPAIVHSTPTVFRHLLGLFDRGGGYTPPLPSVRVVVLGGEEVRADHLAGFFRHFTAQATHVNGYGPTECTLALQHVATRSDLDRRSVPIGHAVEGVAIGLVDADGNEVERFGELVLR
ncbi:MAG: AMP-binding protein, partial [Solirubrobacteraceae bacterium]